LERVAHSFEGPARPSAPVKYNSTQKMLSQFCHIIQKTDTLKAEIANYHTVDSDRDTSKT
jgi:hypothetical protein